MPFKYKFCRLLSIVVDNYYWQIVWRTTSQGYNIRFFWLTFIMSEILIIFWTTRLISCLRFHRHNCISHLLRSYLLFSFSSIKTTGSFLQSSRLRQLYQNTSFVTNGSFTPRKEGNCPQRFGLKVLLFLTPHRLLIWYFSKSEWSRRHNNFRDMNKLIKLTY